MIFFKLNAHHKKWFIINKLAVFIVLIICLFIASNYAKVSLPTNEAKLSASLGFMLIVSVMGLAFINRIATLFKVK